MQNLRFAVIGVGEMGRFHAETLRFHTPGASLVAIADPNLARAQAVASELQITAYESLESLLNGSDIDAVVISSPPKFHGSAIRAVAAAHKQIFCEKPLAITLDDADSALEAVAEARVNLQVGHMRRYDSAYAHARQRIEEGEIGRVILFKSIGRDHQAGPSAAAQTESNGTLFHDSSTHDFDLARWLVADEVAEVHAYAGCLAIPEMKRFGGFDAGVVNLQFMRGAIGNVESFIDARYGYDIRTEVIGTQGTIQIGHIQRTPVTVLTAEGRRQELMTHWLERFAEA
ncbi:MAG TPA: Gfo/Idh/MocA family oxidoreductase, partial [Tepidisphaeraceae bacterium]|nr:Gfo/Idh/MocA family oxidoreductase [Tepidisphaeraceae bacterium]